jgi:hypothetical protein
MNPKHSTKVDTKAKLGTQVQARSLKVRTAVRAGSVTGASYLRPAVRP